jgi:protein-disulfide isomerase
MHKNTWAAHIAASCAEAQGKFWEMHDRVFAGQDEWNGEATSNPKKVLRKYAGEIGLDVNAWDNCFDTRQPVPRIKANAAEGFRRNVNSTPTFFIGNKQALSIGYDEMKRLVDEALAAAKPDSAGRTGKAAKP